MANPILRNRYDECVDVIMGQSCTAFEIFGVVDALKLQSSLTMTYLATANDRYKVALDKFFGGEMCQKTLDFLRITQINPFTSSCLGEARFMSTN